MAVCGAASLATLPKDAPDRGPVCRKAALHLRHSLKLLAQSPARFIERSTIRWLVLIQTVTYLNTLNPTADGYGIVDGTDSTAVEAVLVNLSKSSVFGQDDSVGMPNRRC